MSNNPRNGPELAKTASLDDRHVSAPWGSTTMKPVWGPETVSVDDRIVNAPQGSLIVETSPGPQNSE